MLHSWIHLVTIDLLGTRNFNVLCASFCLAVETVRTI